MKKHDYTFPIHVEIKNSEYDMGDIVAFGNGIDKNPPYAVVVYPDGIFGYERVEDLKLKKRHID